MVLLPLIWQTRNREEVCLHGDIVHVSLSYRGKYNQLLYLQMVG